MFLGIDTSNYTTSAAICSGGGAVRQAKRLLPVAEGQLGLRQSDAVFAHIKALGGLLEELLDGSRPPIRAVGVSTRPRDADGSYMPCFLAGEMAARSVAAALGVPLFTFSHQAGHVAAALFATGNLALAQEPFLAFHVSGGTTECLYVTPDPDRVFAAATLARSLDLHAGQAVDRVGAMLGLPFPAGPALEQLALASAERFSPKVPFKGMDCCLSGLENQCRKRLAEGAAPRDVARWCLDSLASAVITMTEHAVKAHPDTPIVYAGGVMSNGIIRALVEERFACSFAPPAYSADNAAGIAVLCREQFSRTRPDRV